MTPSAIEAPIPRPFLPACRPLAELMCRAPGAVQQALLSLAAGLAVLLQVEATCLSGSDCPAVLLNAAVRVCILRSAHIAQVTGVRLIQPVHRPVLSLRLSSSCCTTCDLVFVSIAGTQGRPPCYGAWRRRSRIAAQAASPNVRAAD